MSSESPHSKKLCFTMCQQFFGGVWRGAKFSDGLVKKLSGSLSNDLYICCLPEEVDEIDGNSDLPRRVLVRFYGVTSADHNAVLQDSLMFALLAERGLGPKFYGCFLGGRFEEYIQSRCLRTSELASPSVSRQVAQRTARLHQLDMPLCKEPAVLREKMTRWHTEAMANINNYLAGHSKSTVWQKILSYDLEGEMKLLLKLLYASKSPVVFCHNDLQEGNILMSEHHSELMLIDFEYASYNFRGFDIANHFCEWCYNYTHTQPPYFSASRADYPSEAQQVYFIRHYLETAAASAAVKADDEEVQDLLREVDIFTLASHMWWTMWSLVSARTSHIQFGYLEYALTRLEDYYVFKKRLFDKHFDFCQSLLRENSLDPIMFGHSAAEDRAAMTARREDTAIAPITGAGADCGVPGIAAVPFTVYYEVARPWGQCTAGQPGDIAFTSA